MLCLPVRRRVMPGSWPMLLEVHHPTYMTLYRRILTVTCLTLTWSLNKNTVKDIYQINVMHFDFSALYNHLHPLKYSKRPNVVSILVSKVNKKMYMELLYTATFL